MTLIMSCMAVVFSVFLVERISRRILLFYSLATLTVLLLGLESTNLLARFLKISLNETKVVLLEIYTLVYPPTIGSLPWVLVTELFTYNLKSRSLAICSCVNFISKTVLIRWLAGASEISKYAFFTCCSFFGQYILDNLFKKMEDEKARLLEGSGVGADSHAN